MNIETVAIESLVPWPGNPRLHGDLDVAQLVESIKFYGWTAPILAQRGTGRVLAGHGRLEAAKLLGIKEVPVVYLDMDEKKAAAYTVADNRLAELSEWDVVKLKEIICELDDGAFKMDLTGFTSPELNKIFGVDAASDAANEVPPLPKVATTKTGDLWLLGDHRLLCGDSTKAEDVARAIGGGKARCVWTDPPYGVSYVGKTKDKLKIQNDGADSLDSLISGAFSALAQEAIYPGAAIYVAHPAGQLALVFDNCFVAQGWRLHQTLIWVKDSMVLGHSDYHFKHEPITFGYAKGDGRFGRGAQGWFGADNAVSVFDIPRPKASPDHPTSKPVELIQAMLLNSSLAGDVVFDPFLGSGSTLIACDRMGRKCTGLEIDPLYCDVIIARWEKITGKTATLCEQIVAK